MGPSGRHPSGRLCSAAAEIPGFAVLFGGGDSCTVIELTPTVLNHIPAATQLSVYKVAIKSTSRVNAYIRAVNGEITAKNTKLLRISPPAIHDVELLANPSALLNFLRAFLECRRMRWI